MRLFFKNSEGIYFCFPKKGEKNIVKKAGFLKNPKNQEMWQTKDIFIASELLEYAFGKTKEEIKSKLQSLEESVKESRMTDSNIAIPVPDGLEYKPFQKAGIAYAIKRKKALIADDMRLGKTIQAIGYINYFFKNTKTKILIICPSTIKLNWKNELEKWLVRKFSIKVVTPKEYKPANIVIINYDLLRKWEKKIKKGSWNLVIADECHMLKNAKSKRTQCAFGNNYRGRNKKYPIQSDRLLLLTGSPIINRPIELYPLLEALDAPIVKKYYSIERFADRYMEREFNGYGWVYKGGKNLQELQQRLRETVMVRRKKEDVLTEMSEKIRQIIPISENENLLKEEKIFSKQMMLKFNKSDDTWIEDILNLSDSEDSIPLTEMAKIRHHTAVLKIPYVSNYCKEILESENKLVIFAHHSDVIKGLAKELSKYNPIVLDGSIPVLKRMPLINKFKKEDKYRICIMGIMLAQGMSLAIADIGIFAELDWVPGNMNQAEDRLFDMEKKTPILIQHIVVDGSIDCKMAKMLISKQEIINKALDDKLIKEGKIEKSKKSL